MVDLIAEYPIYSTKKIGKVPTELENLKSEPGITLPETNLSTPFFSGSLKTHYLRLLKFRTRVYRLSSD